MKFFIGEIVVLRSGGPAMTVEEVRPDGVIDVVWFEDRTLRRDAFLPFELVTTRGPTVA